jgi:hypothetical protein
MLGPPRAQPPASDIASKIAGLVVSSAGGLVIVLQSTTVLDRRSTSD